MLRTIVCALVLLGAGCSTLNRVQNRHVRPMWIATSAVIACDYGQTMWASNGGQWNRSKEPGMVLAEMNPLLGQQPSPALLTAVVLADLGVNTLIYKSNIPPWLKAAYFVGMGVVETKTVALNVYDTGLCGVIAQPPTTLVDPSTVPRR